MGQTANIIVIIHRSLDTRTQIRKVAHRKMLTLVQNLDVFDVEEIFANILLRLPVRSLLGCMCVCRYWRGFIGGAFFIALQLTQSRRKPSYVYYAYLHYTQKEKGPLPLELPHHEGFYFEEMVCSFDGLICYSATSSPNSPPRPAGGRDSRICICNPATGQVMMLPQNPIFKSASKRYRRRVGVAFGPAINGYKVFEFCYRGKRLHECTVYSSATASWKSLGKVAQAPLSSRDHVCIDGTVYWMSTSVKLGQKVRCILAVDGDEKFRTFMLPKGNSSTKQYFLSNVLDRLSLLVVDINYSFDVWSLEGRNRPVWVKRKSDVVPYAGHSRSLRFMPIQKFGLLFATSRFGAVYNMMTKSWTRFPSWRLDCTKFASLPVVPFTESLLPCK